MKKIKSALILFLLAILGTALPPFFHSLQKKDIPAFSTVDGGLSVYFIDVGQAEATLVTSGGMAMLIDAADSASSRHVARVLHAQGVQELEYVVASHYHRDHVGGLDEVLEEFKVKKLILPKGDPQERSKIEEEAKKNRVPIENVKEGMEFALGEARVEMISTDTVYEEENDNSTVIRVVFGNNSFLFTGDMEAVAERELLAQGTRVQSQVLKVSHHGSNTSSTEDFLYAVAPEYAIISAGINNEYGLPNQNALERLAQTGAKIFCTADNGNIMAQADGLALTIQTEREKGEVAFYIGNKKTGKYHTPSCDSLPQSQNRLQFQTEEEAQKLLYSPCQKCVPAQSLEPAA